MSDSIDSLNIKIKETQEAEAFRVKEEKWYLEEQAIKKVEKELAKLQRIQKHLTGPALIKNLEQQ
jgi:ATP-dependent Lon protease